MVWCGVVAKGGEHSPLLRTLVTMFILVTMVISCLQLQPKQKYPFYNIIKKFQI